MTDLIEHALLTLSEQLPARVSRPGDRRFATATAIWAKPVGRMPRAVVHCQTLQERAARILEAVEEARTAGVGCWPLVDRAAGHVSLWPKADVSDELIDVCLRR